MPEIKKKIQNHDHALPFICKISNSYSIFAHTKVLNIARNVPTSTSILLWKGKPPFRQRQVSNSES